MKENTKTRIQYIVLIVITIAILIQFTNQKTITDETSAVVLNLKEENNLYKVENSGATVVNVTISEQNEITGYTILQPNQKIEIDKKNFKAVGERHA